MSVSEHRVMPSESREATASKRILLIEVNEDGTTGGSHQALYDLVLQLDRSRYDPVVMFYQENRFAEALRARGVVVHVWEDVRARERVVHHSGARAAKLLEIARAVRRRREFLLRERIALVHLNNSPLLGHDDWLPAARLTGVPIIASVMGEPAPPEGRGLRPAIHRFLARSFDHVLPVSEYIAAGLRAQDVPRARLTVVHHGIDAAAYRARVVKSPDLVRAELSVPPGRVFVAMVGNIRSWKGQHVVLEALRRMPLDTRNTLFVIFAGAVSDADALYAASLKQIIAAAGLTGLTSFAGARSDVPDILHAADVVVHASTTPEPGGIVVLEAMAIGRPVIAASRGGHVEYLLPDIGLLHDVERPEELAAHLAALAGDPGRRSVLAARARVRVEEYSLGRNVRETQSVYEQVLGA